MKRTTVFIPEGAERHLAALAARRGEPVASLIREAIGEYLVRRGKEASDLGFVAAGRSGRADVAERHEELLFAELGPHGSATRSAGGRRRAAKTSRTPKAGQRRSRR